MARRSALRGILLGLGPLLLACGGGGEPSPSAAAGTAETPASGPLFVDATAEAGIDFVHFNGMTGAHRFAEMMGPGGALVDYDGDGDLDVYLVQGAVLGAGETLADALVPPRHPPPLTDRLYRNEGVDGSGVPRFTDVTAASRLGATGYGMGVAAGDYDNDGDVDLYLTNYGPNQMLRNEGDGTFTDATGATGTAEVRWSVPALFFDSDGDGWLDLYIGNYLDYTTGTEKTCLTETGAPDYCGPAAYNGEPDRLLRNRGDGTFEDVTARAGLLGAPGPALGAVSADFDLDGRPDLYVANDGEPNRLWLNRGDGTFVDEALLAGCAVNEDGLPEASMGVDAADFDLDGDEDLFMAHLTREKNTLYLNDGSGLFTDASVATGLATPSLDFTGFGTAFFDYDNDGLPDILVLNGAVKTLEALARAGDPFPLHQPNQLFHNLGPRPVKAGFEEVTADAGAAFLASEVSRGAAFGDVDNDGDTDVLVINNNGPARLLLNQVGQRRPWIGLRLLDAAGRRDMLGAWVGVERPASPTLWRRVRAGGSYASASDPRLLVGLGDAEAVEAVTVRWPDGSGERFTGLAPRRYHDLRQGSGAPWRAADDGAGD